jgi:hypothetical protein
MNDLIFVSVIVAFFAGSVVYAACCEKLEADPSAPALIVTEPAVGYRLLGALK